MHENIWCKMIVKNRTKNLAEFYANECHKSEIRYAFDWHDETLGPSNQFAYYCLHRANVDWTQ